MSSVLDMLLGGEDPVSVMQPGPVRTERKGGLFPAIVGAAQNYNPVSLVSDAVANYRALAGNTTAPETQPLTTEWVAKKLGIDTEDPAYQAGSLMPGPGSLSKLGMLTGAGAIGRASTLYGKKAAEKAAKHAARMEKDGASQADIWRETGRMFKVPLVKVRGEWFSEVPDFVDPYKVQEGTKDLVTEVPGLGMFKIAPESQKRMPELGYAEIQGKKMKKGELGAAGGNRMRINVDNPATQNPEVIAHEGQHILSQSDKAYKGGMGEQIWDQLDPSTIRAAEALKNDTYNRAVSITAASRDAGYQDPIDFIRDNKLSVSQEVVDFIMQNPTAKEMVFAKRRAGDAIKEAETIYKQYDALPEPQRVKLEAIALREARNRGETIDIQDMRHRAAAMWQYARQADEGFARASGSRVNMTMDRRIENPFWEGSQMSYKNDKGQALLDFGLEDLQYNPYL